MLSITCVLIFATSVLETIIAPIGYLLMLILANGVILNANASDSNPPPHELRIIQLLSIQVLLVAWPHSDSLWRLVGFCRLDRLLVLIVKLILMELLAYGGRIAFPLRTVQEMVRFYATICPALSQGTLVTYSKPVHS